MNIVLLNTEEAGMPAEMAENCRILLERRIQKLFPEQLPETGEGIAILYSESDPLGTTFDENAYEVYFTVETVTAAADRTQTTIQLALAY